MRPLMLLLLTVPLLIGALALVNAQTSARELTDVLPDARVRMSCHVSGEHHLPPEVG